MLVTIVANLSMVDHDTFLTVLDNRSWMHPFDDKGHRRNYSDIPESVSDLVDDPFRSLAGELRRLGRFAKDTTPSANFCGRTFCAGGSSTSSSNLILTARFLLL